MGEHSRRIQGFWRDNQLFSALLELTYRCNLDCAFCYNDVGLKGRPLTRQRYGELLEELAELGVLHLALSGGEPLAHPDFFTIGARARELGFVIRVKSNGHALRGALARRLRDEVDPYRVEVSLHGARAETHDRQTRVPGSHERLLANLAELKSLGVRLQINSTLTRWNESEIEGMFAIADRLETPLQIDPEVTQRDDGDRSPLSLRATAEGLRRLYALQMERDRRGAAADEPAAPVAPIVVRQGDAVAPPVATSGKYCGAGSSNVCVDPYGGVYPCVQWRRPVGNLNEQSLREIWTTSAALREVRSLGEEVARKLAGEQPALLSFCPGQAEIATGDPTRLYETAAERRSTLRGLLPALLPVVD